MSNRLPKFSILFNSVTHCAQLSEFEFTAHFTDTWLCRLSSHTPRLLPLQVTAINYSMCAASWAPTSRWGPLSRTWWHGGPGSLNTPSPSPLLTQWVQRCFVWWWTWSSSSCTVCLCSLLQPAKRRNMINSQRKPQPRSAAAAKSLAS